MTPAPAPALLVLRAQLNQRYPQRSKASDGIMGDAAHRLRKSAHNAGNALDVTNDPAHGPDLDRLVEELARQMRANPTGGRLRLMIWQRRIWSGPAWRPVKYFGVNPHTGHAHIEVRPPLRDITRLWSLP